MRVIVGSTSTHKLEAVRKAFAELDIVAEVSGVKAPSGVNEQPEKAAERDEIWEGAHNRAHRVFLACGCDLAIGIENGIEETNFVYDYAVVACLSTIGIYGARSSGFPVEPSDVEEARRRGFDKHTVASVTRERTGCDATDATPYYTAGRMNRSELLTQAVKLVICQWLAKENVNV